MTSAGVEELHGRRRIQTVHVDEVPADQVPGAVQAMGAVNSDQLAVVPVLPQEPSHRPFEAQDGGIRGNLGPSVKILM